ncbi:MAG: maltose alpha-D-glucosyltransferase [Gemmatimonadota bacterium]
MNPLAPSLRRRPPRARPRPASDPLWFKDAVIYELHVRSFHDSNGDGIGDFQGLRRKLDYLQELGVTALWLLPFYPSPLRDDGYDIADYHTVHPSYGTLDDFRAFLEEAHRRGLKVITELVINHTSDQHPWFQRARRAPPGSPEREMYVWSDTPDRYSDARIIFTDFEPSNWSWDPVAQAYFWHRFYGHQPDLNYDNPEVHERILQVLDYWFEMGVDGMRLDAIPYLYEREGTSCENLPETHAFLRKLRSHVDERFANRMLLAEANQWPEDAAAYFGDGDECHMNFHFPIMPRLFMALQMEDRFPIVDILEQTPAIPANSQWALFLRNHDELTLEMVTDEERDYMYRVYARDRTARINLGIRRRLGPLLENDRRQIELLNSLLLSLPGTPVIYYGDEIGMGDNFYLGDRNGVRTPMQWSADRNAGFSEANPQRLFLPVVIDPEYYYGSVNVEAQQANPSSLLWWMRRIISLRRRHPAFGRGSFRWVHSDNRHILAFLRQHEGESILVVANLSRFPQACTLDLSDLSGRVPVELFGRTRFPAADGDPYPFSLGPYGFYWFRLEATPTDGAEGEPTEAPVLAAETEPVEIFHEARWDALGPPLLRHARRSRWYRGKGRTVREAAVADVLDLDGSEARRLALLRVGYVASDSDADVYVVPLELDAEEDADDAADSGGIATVEVPDGSALLRDGLEEPETAGVLLDLILERGTVEGQVGALVGLRTQEDVDTSDVPTATVSRAEQSNTSVIFGDRWILKVFRKLEAGPNLDREVVDYLTRRGFPNTPAIHGALEYRPRRGEPATLAVLQQYVRNQGDVWSTALESLERYFERALASGADARQVDVPATADRAVPSMTDLLGPGVVDLFDLLGRRTAELHRTLADTDEPAFRPEPYTPFYQRSLYQSIRNLVGQTFRLLEAHEHRLDPAARERARHVLRSRDDILERSRPPTRAIGGKRIRVHGDYHMGQVLSTGRDVMIIDFEGEPARPLGERRLKRSPLRDVAGMLRSFHYAASMGRLRQEEITGGGDASTREALAAWADLWCRWATRLFLGAYLRTERGAGLVPSAAADRRFLLDYYLIEKALRELGYEVENRPSWAWLPLEGLLELLGTRPGPESRA